MSIFVVLTASGVPMNPFGINPFNPGHQFMTPGILNFPPSPYPILNDAWLDQKKSVRKRSQKTNKKEKVKKKVNCVYDSDTPPPNVDVSAVPPTFDKFVLLVTTIPWDALLNVNGVGTLTELATFVGLLDMLDVTVDKEICQKKISKNKQKGKSEKESKLCI
jgi:hypothetical protein